ncbi:hypothetical protein DERF_009153 [Dermatophagoides farinae]|uniref:Integrase zinc-binding domain-containing protein n=1 Tax=Dermatophagoides farinae TaxID=6954 RepID=A0A922L162_DERFA|nr:hypothetical protein DERF_009153 [Dermatophagoides farinae]
MSLLSPLAYSNIGQHKCLDIVFCRFYWPKWRNDVKQWIRKCVCNVKKDNDPHPANQPMSATDIVNLNPFEKVAIDIMTLSSSESGNRYIFVPVVHISLFLEFLIMASSIKKSKLSETCCSRKFQAWWTDRYGMIEKDNKVICVLCCTTLVCRTSSVKRHYETNHKFLLGRSVEEQKEYISRALKIKMLKLFL